MSLAAFQLTAAFRGSFLGGVVAIDDARSVDVLDLLRPTPEAEPDQAGVIVVDTEDVALLRALEHLAALEPTELPEGATPDLAYAHVPRPPEASPIAINYATGAPAGDELVDINADTIVPPITAPEGDESTDDSKAQG